MPGSPPALDSVAPILLMCASRHPGTAIGGRRPALESDPSDVGAQHPDMVGTGAAPLHGTIENFIAARMDDAISNSPKEFFEPNLYLYDAYPGGIGFSEPLFRMHALLVHKTRALIAACPCDQGCPSCVGPAADLAPRAQEAALAILDRLCA